MNTFQVLDCHNDNIYYHPEQPYKKFVQAQEIIWQKRVHNYIPDTLVVTTHPPTITLGARAKHLQLKHISALPQEWRDDPDELYFSKAKKFLQDEYMINLLETKRGGSVWYHDPGVLHFYLIAEIKDTYPASMCRALEETLYQTVRVFVPHADRIPNRFGRDMNQYIGVWIDGKKIAGVGLEVRQKHGRKITKFGAAINVNPDMTRLGLIHPCGIIGCAATSLEESLPSIPSSTSVLTVFLKKFVQEFECALIIN